VEAEKPSDLREQLLEFPLCLEAALEGAVLDPLSVVEEEICEFGTATVTDDVIADEVEHLRLLAYFLALVLSQSISAIRLPLFQRLGETLCLTEEALSQAVGGCPCGFLQFCLIGT